MSSDTDTIINEFYRRLKMKFRLIKENRLECNYWDIDKERFVGWVIWDRVDDRLWKVFCNSASMSKKKYIHISNRMHNLFERKYQELLIDKEIFGGYSDEDEFVR